MADERGHQSWFSRIRASSCVSKETTPMLARRFTIVCLLMSLFGMFFAILVAEAGRPARAWTAADVCQLGCVNQSNR